MQFMIRYCRFKILVFNLQIIYGYKLSMYYETVLHSGEET